jgi:4a-hydroxytetrahydrobiopterin dehydratase
MDERVEITLYTRQDCFLCDKAKSAIRAAESLYRLPIDLREIDVDGDEALRARYTNDVPVILINGTEAFRHRVDPRELAEAIRGGVCPPATLARETCVPCHGGTPKLEWDEIDSLRRELGNGWSVSPGHHLEREFTFPDFAEALAFTNRVGAIAEGQGHHPAIHLEWGRVRLEIWTHAIDGLSRNDFVLAAKIDQSLLVA